MTNSSSPSEFEISGRTWRLRAAKNGSAKQPSNKWINAYGSIYVGKTVKEFGWYDRQEKPNSLRWAGPKDGFSCPAPQRERDEEQ